MRRRRGYSALLRCSAGIGLVEILIAAVAMGVVSLAALGIYRSQHSQYLQQTDVSEMQQNLRVVMDEMATQIRQAGYMAQGVLPVQVFGADDDMLILRYHDGDSVRAKVYFLLTDTTGQQNLMTQLNGETPQILAEGIDSVRFQAGGAGGAIDWVVVDLVARSQHAGFRTGATATDPHSKPHLYRRLTSTVKLRNG
jgi:hypothetical protein